jgi:thiol-disulfide isomerase/thioredoxin
MKFFFLSAICSFQLVSSAILGQKQKKFTLVVNYKSETNQILGIVESYFFKQYKAATFVNDTVSADNNQYIFTGELLYPTAIRVYNYDKKPNFNELLFIDSGYQEIRLTRHDTIVSLSFTTSSKIEKEHRDFIKKMEVSDIDKKIPFKFFEEYVKNKPNSYVALFALISQVFNYDFSPELKRISTHFDSTIQATKGYEYFTIQYLKSKKIPNLIVKNTKQKSATLNFNNADGKYTFVEFWFTGCTACIPIMLSLKKNYNSLSHRIRVISICTDPKNIVPESLKMIKKLNLPWQNYWDYKANQFEKYTLLYSYPANLLIDNNGLIIGKNVNISGILDFLPAINK